jgi:MFS family permease
MSEMRDTAGEAGWLALLRREWIPALAVLLGGVLLHSMNVLLVATVLPSIVEEVGGAALMSWPTTAFLASSIVAATCTGLVTVVVGAGRAFCTGALIFCAGTLLCAFAPAMSHIIAGRFVQGFGGGLLSAVAYVLVRNTFPEGVWPRVFALLAGVWSVSVLVGPLVGGVFASHGNWRGAFFAVAALAGLLALAIAALGVVLRLDRAAAVPLLPSDAFSLRSATGVGLWIALLVSIAFVPLQIFVPVFLQTLHRFDPLAAGYTVAGASMAWTAAAVAVAGLSTGWSERMVIAGPLTMGAGLLGVAVAMPSGPVAVLVPAIALVGVGIGACWALTAPRPPSQPFNRRV